MSDETKHLKWSWLTEDRSSQIADKIMGLGKQPPLFRNKIGLDAKNRITIDGDVIPHDMLPYFFQNAFSVKTINPANSAKFDFDGSKYDLFINNKRYSFVELSDGTIKYLKDDELHCAQGPAWLSKDQKEAIYYKDGQLHRTDGPAKVAEKPIYALNGNALPLFDYVENNPDNIIYSGVRGGSGYIISKWNDYSTISALDGSKIFLKKSEGPKNADSFIAELVSQNIRDYVVVDYPRLGPAINPIYNLVKECGPWEYESTSTETILRATKPLDTTYLSFNKETKELNFKSNEFSTPINLKVDFGFESTPNADILSNISIKRDVFGRKHNIIGPAIRYPDGREEYYIYGFKVSKLEFETSHLDLETGRIYWIDAENNLHSPSVYTPGEIYPDSSCKYYLNGKYHSEITPAYEVQGDGFRINRYFVCGHELSSNEFFNYDRFDKEVAFKLRNGQYHRIDGPAQISFNDDDSITQRWFVDGMLHNDSGPAIINSNGAVEYWKNGVKSEEGNINDMNIKPKLKLTPVPRPSSRLNLKGEKMNIKTIKIGQSGSDATDTRAQQVTSGTKLGLKKGALKVASEKAAKALSKVIPIPEAIPAERLLQLIMLLGTAEVMERLPNNLAAKVGMTLERREEFSGLSRFISGEILGRDAINIVSSIAPMLIDAVRQISTEDINDLSNDFEPITASDVLKIEVAEEIAAPFRR